MVAYYITGTTVDVTTAETTGNYYFTVTTYDKGYNESEPSKEVNALGINLLYPPSASSELPTNLELLWQEYAGATSYHIQVSDRSDFSHLTVDQAGVVGTSHGISGLENNTRYYWRISPDNTGLWSSSWSFVTQRKYFETLWAQSAATNNLPEWFTTTKTSETGLAYNAGNLYVISNQPTLNIEIIDASTGEHSGSLNVTGIEQNAGLLSDIECCENAILACNITDDVSVTPFKMYYWQNAESSPVVLFSYSDGNYKLGSDFSVIGSMQSEAAIFVPVINSNLVLRWNITAGVADNEPTVITLQNISNLGEYASVSAVVENQTVVLYVNGNGTTAKFDTQGNQIADYPNLFTESASTKFELFDYKGFRFALALRNEEITDASSQNCVMADIETGELYGFTPQLGSAYDNSAFGDIAYSISESGVPVIYVLSAKNGIGAYTIAQFPPIVENISIAGILKVEAELNVEYDYIDPNNDPEGGTKYQWYRASDANGTDTQAIVGAIQSAYTLTASDEGKYISCSVTPVAKEGTFLIGDTYNSPNYGAVAPAEAPPVASNLYIEGIFEVWRTLTAHYTYSDINGDTEGNSVIRWFRATSASGAGRQIISGESGITYQVREADKGYYIFFDLRPEAQTGIQFGDQKQSPTVGPIEASTSDCNPTTLADINFYPNPTTGKMILDNSAGFIKLKIVNTVGSVLIINELNGYSNYSIDLSLMPAGVYLAYLFDNEGNKSILKIVKL